LTTVETLDVASTSSEFYQRIDLNRIAHISCCKKWPHVASRYDKCVDWRQRHLVLGRNGEVPKAQARDLNDFEFTVQLWRTHEPGTQQHCYFEIGNKLETDSLVASSTSVVVNTAKEVTFTVTWPKEKIVVPCEQEDQHPYYAGLGPPLTLQLEHFMFKVFVHNKKTKRHACFVSFVDQPW